MRGILLPAADRPAAWLQATLSLTTWGALVGGTVLLVVRRLAGALDVPLSAAEMAAVGLALATLAVIAPSWPVADRASARSRRSTLGDWITWLIAAAGAAAASLPNSPPFGLALLWGSLTLVALATSRSWRYAPVGRRFVSRLHARFLPVEPSGRRSGDRDRGPLKFGRFDPSLSQVLVRFERHGRDIIRGRIRAIVPRGRRTASAHVAFCPPFIESPLLVIQPGNPADEVRVEAGQVLPHGARLEVKLARPAGNQSAVQIEFSAEATLPLDAPPESGEREP